MSAIVLLHNGTRFMIDEIATLVGVANFCLAVALVSDGEVDAVSSFALRAQTVVKPRIGFAISPQHADDCSSRCLDSLRAGEIPIDALSIKGSANVGRFRVRDGS